jgi:general secretion pathway protein K
MIVAFLFMRRAPRGISVPAGAGRVGRERGLALVSVLWTLILLSLIAASLTTSLDFSYRLAHNGDERARAEALADAGIARGVLALLDRRPEKRWRIDGAVTTFNYDGVPLRIAIEDELGKIDLNGADGPLLEGLFRSVGIDPQTASVLADRILDWRDRSETHRLNGAKDAEYRAAGYAYGPRNGPFQATDELKLVMGMTPALFERIAPEITVYSGRQFVDPQTASRAVLMALPNVTEARIEEILAARAGDGSAASSEGRLDPGVPLGGRAFTIRAEIDDRAGKFTRETVVRLTDDPAQPYWVLSWR